MLEITHIKNQMFLMDFYRTFYQMQKNIPFSQHLLECSPKLTIYSGTKKVSKDRRQGLARTQNIGAVRRARADENNNSGACRSS